MSKTTINVGSNQIGPTIRLRRLTPDKLRHRQNASSACQRAPVCRCARADSSQRRYSKIRASANAVVVDRAVPLLDVEESRPLAA